MGPGVLHFEIEAESDPQVFSRVLYLFSGRNLVPLRAVAVLEPADRLQIEIIVASLTESEGYYLSKKIENIPTVIQVRQR